MKLNVDVSDNEEDSNEYDDGDSEAGENEEYDSMIENGTSEDDENGEENHSDEESEKEKPPPPKGPKKRKINADPPLIVPVKKSKTNDLARPPTLEEINQLNETQNLFHSNLFRFQIEEMLKEIRITKKQYRAIDEWLEKFNQVLTTLKSDDKNRVFDKVYKKIRNKMGVELPIADMEGVFDEYRTKDPTFKFLKPNKAKIIGSARQQTMVGPNLTVDLCIEMPKEVFELKSNKDHLNGNYLQKRAFFLCYIASKIAKGEDICRSIKFSYWQNDTLNPILIIEPIGDKLENRVKFNVRVCCDEESFKVPRFSLMTNNARIKQGADLSADDLKPTPSYNTMVLRDLRTMRNEEFIDDLIQGAQSIRDAIKLLKIWLRQRQLDGTGLGMSGFVVTMFVCFLLQAKKISKSMSSYQIVRTVWNSLSQSEWNVKGISLWRPPCQTSPPSLEIFHEHFDCVFTDQSGYLNLLSNFNVDVYNRIKNESENAIRILNDLTLNSFKSLFMMRMPIHLQYDHIISISNYASIKVEDEHDPFGNKFEKLLKKLANPLRRALDNRVISVTPFFVIASPDGGWNLNELPTPEKWTIESINFGLTLNPDHAFEILVKGPAANDPASLEFRKFWGENSTLRRFQDGTITEAVVLCSANDNLPQKRLITKKITEIVFKQHLGLDSNDFEYIANTIDNHLEFKSTKSAEELSLNVIQTFDEVAKSIRAMEDLPLAITGVQGVSSVFRYSDPQPSYTPARFHNKTFISSRIYHGKLQLVPSGKWPTTLEAMQRIKAAFYIKIAQNLRIDKFAKTRAHCNGVDVLRGDHVFRFSITHPKEIALIKREVTKGDLVVKYRDTPVSLAMEMESVLLVKLTSFLHSIYLANPAFGPTVCLAKQWLHVHNMDTTLISDECVELLVANIFTKPQPYHAPNQPQLGFLRFLDLLATTDWINEMIVLNFNEEITDDELTTIEKQFQTNRESFPSLCILTSCDSGHHSIWTRSGPKENVLARIVLLARHSIAFVEKQILRGHKFDPTPIFKDTMVGYDLVINLNLRQTEKSPAGLDFVECYLHELRQAYDEMALFFFNPKARDRVAVLFRPDFHQSKDFKTSQVNGRQIDMETMKLVPNLKAVIKDFELIGKGLVHRVEYMKKV